MLGSSLANNARAEKKFLGPGSHPTASMLRRYFKYVFSAQTPNSASAPPATANLTMATTRWKMEKNEVYIPRLEWLFSTAGVLGYVAAADPTLIKAVLGGH